MAVRRKYIRAVVEQLLADQNIHSAPVPVDKIAQALNAHVHHEPTAEDNLSGFLIRDVKTRQAVIGVNQNHGDNRKRFTVAHELGHLMLHEGDKFHVDRADGIDSGFRVKLRSVEASAGTDDEEKEANYFAAELLMPISFLDKDLKNLEAVDLLDDNENLQGLAKQYEVSVQALTFRLANLGYIQQ